MWKNRCDHVHGGDAKERQQQAQSHHKRRVQACCSFLPDAPATDRTLFDTSSAETLSKHPSQIETWLMMVEALNRQIKREQLDPKCRRTKDIKECFRQPATSEFERHKARK